MFKISNSLKKNIAQVACLTIAFTPVIGYAAGSGRAANLQSHGKVNYTNGTDNVVIDSNDLVTLANEIDTLEENAKWGQVQAIQSLPAVAQKNSLTGVTLDTVENVTFDQINNAIKNSQKVNPNGDEKVYVNNTNGRAEAAGTSGATEVQITGATANNLSAGTAAWVDGQYIVGNGADNNSYYASGIGQGLKSLYSSTPYTQAENNVGGSVTATDADHNEHTLSGSKSYRFYLTTANGNNALLTSITANVSLGTSTAYSEGHASANLSWSITDNNGVTWDSGNKSGTIVFDPLNKKVGNIEYLDLNMTYYATASTSPGQPNSRGSATAQFSNIKGNYIVV